MKKIEHLAQWTRGRDWFYLQEVPLDTLKMSRPTASTALRKLTEYGILDYRIVGLKQYRFASEHRYRQYYGETKCK